MILLLFSKNKKFYSAYKKKTYNFLYVHSNFSPNKTFSTSTFLSLFTPSVIAQMALTHPDTFIKIELVAVFP